jgi:hypothetical protein
MNVVKIADYVNTTLKGFQASGTPDFAAPRDVIVADRYARSWTENQRILAHFEHACKKAQEIPDKESLKVPLS